MTHQSFEYHVIGGGTVSHVRAHMALAATAYGETARYIHTALAAKKLDARLHLTRMADSGRGKLETAEDIRYLTGTLVRNPATKIIFFNPAIVDFNGQIGDVASGKYATRLQSRSADPVTINLTPADKIISDIRRKRKDVFLVAFKTTAGVGEDDQYAQGLDLLKRVSANLVLANDLSTRMNMVITPEEARYHVTHNRNEALDGLIEMAMARAHLTFTRSTVLENEPPVAWNSNEIPGNLRRVVDHLIERGAYQPFRGKTVGHFAVRGREPNEFLTSRRKSDFNQLAQNGLVRVFAEGMDHVIAHGGKPSVGGQSQRIIFRRNPDLDCIVHFHGEQRDDAADHIPVRQQRLVECGSHECGQNTADGLREVRPGIHAVMLDNHGPNIVFGRHARAEDVIDFIEDNFALGHKTGGNIPPAYRLAVA